MIAYRFALYLFVTMGLLISGDPEPVIYQSEKLLDLKFKRVFGQFTILDDGAEEIRLIGLKDQDGILYWHRRLKTPVCITGECKLIDIGIYWYCTGDFFGFETYGEHLTKTDHSDFTSNDYDRLIQILKIDWSKLREYELSDLVDDVFEDAISTDGTSGATKKEIAAEAVKDAVYTTHTIWHLIHVGEKEQLMNLTAGELNEDTTLIEDLFRKDHLNYYRLFILKLIADGELREGNWRDSVVIESLKDSDNKEIQNLAIKSISKSDYSDPSFLNDLTKIYQDFQMERKMQLLREFQKLPSIPDELYRVIVHDIENQQDWYVIGVFQLFKKIGDNRTELATVARKIGKTDNQVLKNILMEFQ